MTKNNTKNRFDQIYKATPLDQIPWNHEDPPGLLVELIDSGKIKPCRVLDLGCGAGNYAIYLASRGFNVTAVDISAQAIKIAKQNAKKKNVKCTFLTADLTDKFPNFTKPFDFIYDWGLLHHIGPRKRKTYTKNVATSLKPKGLYFNFALLEKIL